MPERKIIEKPVCERCGKPIYQNKYGEWKHYPYHGSYPHKARIADHKEVNP
jgi:hypothetical protein